MKDTELARFLFERERRNEMVFFNEEWNESTSSKYEHLEDYNLIGGLTAPKTSNDWWKKINNKNNK